MFEAPLLNVAIQHQAGPLTLDVSFQLTTGWTVLFGASGSGKTTILRAIQGLLRPHTGWIQLHEATLVDTAQKLFIPPHRRSVRSAGQTPRLFSGKTVSENIAFGAEPNVIPEILSLFRLENLASTMPDRLSGGEQQRVSIARAVASAVTSQSLLLLDEPFSGLDFQLRDTLAIELRDWLHRRRIPALSVTHDVSEVFLLQAEVLRLANGRIAAQGPVSQILAAERDRLLLQLRT